MQLSVSMPLLYFRERFASCDREGFPGCTRSADSRAEPVLPSPLIPLGSSRSPALAPGRTRCAFAAGFPPVRSHRGRLHKVERVDACAWHGGKLPCLEIRYGTAAGKKRGTLLCFRTKGRAGCPRVPPPLWAAEAEKHGKEREQRNK